MVPTREDPQVVKAFKGSKIRDLLPDCVEGAKNTVWDVL